LNRGSSQNWRNSSLWYPDTVVESASAVVELVAVDSAREVVGKPDYDVKKRRSGREEQA
jgi:hypothetical protein